MRWAFRYERRGQPPAPVSHFAWRLLFHALVVVAIGGVSLFIGMFGYVRFEGLSWLDAFLNAAMLLGGMGPIHEPVTRDGKLFAGLYACPGAGGARGRRAADSAGDSPGDALRPLGRDVTH